MTGVTSFISFLLPRVISRQGYRGQSVGALWQAKLGKAGKELNFQENFNKYRITFLLDEGPALKY